MKHRKYTRSVNILVEPKMFELYNFISEKENISVSEIIRTLTTKYLSKIYSTDGYTPKEE